MDFSSPRTQMHLAATYCQVREIGHLCGQHMGSEEEEATMYILPEQESPSDVQIKRAPALASRSIVQRLTAGRKPGETAPRKRDKISWQRTCS